jgi:hypothetical protein
MRDRVLELGRSIPGPKFVLARRVLRPIGEGAKSSQLGPCLRGRDSSGKDLTHALRRR